MKQVRDIMAIADRVVGRVDRIANLLRLATENGSDGEVRRIALDALIEFGEVSEDLTKLASGPADPDRNEIAYKGIDIEVSVNEKFAGNFDSSERFVKEKTVLVFLKTDQSYGFNPGDNYTDGSLAHYGSSTFKKEYRQTCDETSGDEVKIREFINECIANTLKDYWMVSISNIVDRAVEQYKTKVLPRTPIGQAKPQTQQGWQKQYVPPKTGVTSFGQVVATRENLRDRIDAVALAVDYQKIALAVNEKLKDKMNRDLSLLIIGTPEPGKAKE